MIEGVISAYSPDQNFGQDEPAMELRVKIERRQIGDRMASDSYVLFQTPLGNGVFAIPFRQLKRLVEGDNRG